jgi:hypothetical protein
MTSEAAVGTALARVDAAQAEVRDNWSRGADEAELTALRELAETVRVACCMTESQGI